MTTESVTFEIRSGYKPTETMMVRNPVDLKEMIAHCNSHSHIWLRDCKGNARTVKVNGKVHTWKRDPTRIKVPIKHGLYEYVTLTSRDIVDVLIPVK